MEEDEVFCEVRYRICPENRAAFEDYARAWMGLIEKHGGRHLGFFMPRAAPDDGDVSYPGVDVLP